MVDAFTLQILNSRVQCLMYFREQMQLWKTSISSMQSGVALPLGYSRHSLTDLTNSICKTARLFCHRTVLKSNDTLAYLQECTESKSILRGKAFHAKIIKAGKETNICHANHLLNWSLKCGIEEDAHRLFDEMPEGSLVKWNIMVSSYAHNGNGIEALKCLQRMMQQRGLVPDKFTFSSVLGASARGKFLAEGMQIHALIVKNPDEFNVKVQCALLDMYAKCGKMQEAWLVFGKMSEKSIVACNAMIAGLGQNGEFEEALKMFRETHWAGIWQDEFTVSSALSACSKLSALLEGAQIHALCLKSFVGSNVVVGSAVVDMYAKSGVIEDARLVFESMNRRNLVTWNAMITGLSQHGKGKETLQMLDDMKRAGFKPNEVTFVGVLHVCSHAGMVEQGRAYFESMIRDHSIRPNVHHYACLVDLLSRAGRLNEAEDIIRTMPCRPNAATWGPLLGASRVHGNLVLAREAAERLFELEPQRASNHVLLSNTYAAAEKWDDVERIWKRIRDTGLKKDTGKSWIDYKGKVHVFVVGDTSHSQSEELYALLDSLNQEMKDAGYVPETEFSLHDVEEQQREKLLGHHSEKLALAFGLLNLPAGSTIRIKKNLRVCGDCHTVFKFASLVVKREIVLGDRNRFHHFHNGSCSCGDYW